MKIITDEVIKFSIEGYSYEIKITTDLKTWESHIIKAHPSMANFQSFLKVHSKLEFIDYVKEGAKYNYDLWIKEGFDKV